MKSTCFLIIIFSLIASYAVHAQAPVAIEADLLTRFKKINYWSQHIGKDLAGGQLFKANADFAKNFRIMRKNTRQPSRNLLNPWLKSTST